MRGGDEKKRGADHTTTLGGGQPTLALNMYEHAYQMDYGAKAGDYVETFMQANPLSQCRQPLRAADPAV